MRFFNLDLHISVIADIRAIFAALGHEVVSWNLSAHTWVFGERPSSVDVVNAGTWRQLDPSMCDAFYKRYADELSGFDGFIVTFPPSFALLFEAWRKPIIIVAPIRYELPFTADPRRWEWLNERLVRGIDAGTIIPLANNRYDAAYAELFTGRKWRVVPSLCEYTRTAYTGTRSEYLYWSKFKPTSLPGRLVDKDTVFRPGWLSKVIRKAGLAGRRGYKWSDVAEFRGIVHVPYNCSIMSLFEHYAAGIPLFFPSREFLMELHRKHFREGVLSELSFNQIEGLPPGSAIAAPDQDPNDYASCTTVGAWIGLADFYDPEQMPFIQYFDSFDHLDGMLSSADTAAISADMRGAQAKRKEAVIGAWRDILAAMP